MQISRSMKSEHQILYGNSKKYFISVSKFFNYVTLYETMRIVKPKYFVIQWTLCQYYCENFEVLTSWQPLEALDTSFLQTKRYLQVSFI